MHEMALCESLVSLLEEQAAKRRFSRVKAIELELGLWSCAEPESLTFCFASAARGTLAEGARLDIHVRPGRAWCWSCGDWVELNAQLADCPACNSGCIDADRNETMRIKALEVT